MVAGTVSTRAKELQSEYDKLILEIFDLADEIEHSAFPNPDTTTRLLELQARAREVDGHRNNLTGMRSRLPVVSQQR